MGNEESIDLITDRLTLISGQGGNGDRVGPGNAITVCDREDKNQLCAALDPGNKEPKAIVIKFDAIIDRWLCREGKFDVRKSWLELLRRQ